MHRGLFFSLALCAAIAQGAPDTSAKSASASEEYLLLQRNTVNEAEAFQTLWVKVSSRGAEVLGSFPQMLIAWGGTLYALDEVTAEYQAFDCEDLFSGDGFDPENPGNIEAQAYDYQRAVLQDVLSKDPKPSWISQAAPFDPKKGSPIDNAGSFSTVATLQGLAGPYLSFASCDDVYFCGAHGAAVCEGFTFNLETQKAVPMKDEKLFRKPTPKELAALKWDTKDPSPIAAEDGNIAIWRSQYGASGLELSLLITRDTAYAMSSGEWSSYTTTALFPQKRIPKAFAPYKALPKGLAQFASSGQSKLIGFSKIQKSEAVDRYLSAHAKPAKPVK